MDGLDSNPEPQQASMLRKITRRVLLYCGAFLAVPGIGIFAWEILLRTSQPGEDFRWTPMLFAAGFIVLANLAFAAAGKLGAPNTSTWIKGVGMACFAILVWSQINRTKQNQPATGKPGLQGRELLRQYQESHPQTGNQPGPR